MRGARGASRNNHDVAARFWQRTERVSSGCFLWVGGFATNGYGLFYVGQGERHYAHRYAYVLANGFIPTGLQLDHLCRNRACVNPDHLEPVTSKENTMRGAGVSARNAAKTRCMHGHPFDELNTYLYMDKQGRTRRDCRTCRAAAVRARRTKAAS